MLSNFNKITLIVSMTILIVVLALYGVVLYSSMQNSNYPPIKNDCPDYWDVSEKDGKMSCEIKHNINSGDFREHAAFLALYAIAHDLWRGPARPFSLAGDLVLALPGEAVAADTDPVGHGLALAGDVVEAPV